MPSTGTEVLTAWEWGVAEWVAARHGRSILQFSAITLPLEIPDEAIKIF